jgi:hypothetical protein
MPALPDFRALNWTAACRIKRNYRRRIWVAIPIAITVIVTPIIARLFTANQNAHASLKLGITIMLVAVLVLVAFAILGLAGDAGKR